MINLQYHKTKLFSSQTILILFLFIILSLVIGWTTVSAQEDSNDECISLQSQVDQRVSMFKITQMNYDLRLNNLIDLTKTVELALENNLQQNIDFEISKLIEYRQEFNQSMADVISTSETISTIICDDLDQAKALNLEDLEPSLASARVSIQQSLDHIELEILPQVKLFSLELFGLEQ